MGNFLDDARAGLEWATAANLEPIGRVIRGIGDWIDPSSRNGEYQQNTPAPQAVPEVQTVGQTGLGSTGIPWRATDAYNVARDTFREPYPASPPSETTVGRYDTPLTSAPVIPRKKKGKDAGVAAEGERVEARPDDIYVDPAQNTYIDGSDGHTGVFNRPAINNTATGTIDVWKGGDRSVLDARTLSETRPFSEVIRDRVWSGITNNTADKNYFATRAMFDSPTRFADNMRMANEAGNREKDLLSGAFGNQAGIEGHEISADSAAKVADLHNRGLENVAKINADNMEARNAALLERAQIEKEARENVAVMKQPPSQLGARRNAKQQRLINGILWEFDGENYRRVKQQR